jgi:Heavy metal associated domain 2
VAAAGTAGAIPLPRASLEHRGSNRVRARVAREDRSPERMDRLRRQLSAHPAVDSVEVNHRTGSVLVHGEVATELEGAVRESLELVEEAGPENVPEAGVESVVLLVREVDRKLRRTTGSRLSLRWLVPTAFVGVGLRQLVREGLTLGSVPWYVLIYYGVDSFLKLYPQHAPKDPGRPPA